MLARGPFDVNVTPATDTTTDPILGRMILEKQFHGDLEATGQGQMLTAGTVTNGSAGYVALERVSGTLHGRNGSFVLYHVGLLTRGVPNLRITVVPDSGTDQLVGLAGSMTITNVDGAHSYEFDYTLAE